MHVHMYVPHLRVDVGRDFSPAARGTSSSSSITDPRAGLLLALLLAPPTTTRPAGALGRGRE